MELIKQSRKGDSSKYKCDLSTRLQGSRRLAVYLESSERIPSLVDLFGIQLICCNCEDAAKALARAIVNPKVAPILLIHVNAHSLRCISRRHELRERLGGRAWLLLEGIGLKAACLVTKGWAPADTNGTDLFPALLAQLRSRPCRLFLLGGEPNVGALAKQKIEEDWPHVEIVGWRDGFFSDEELPAIRDQVSNARPTLLLIGMGSPKQETLALEFRQTSDLQLVWAVGGLFDRLSGRIARAPPLMLKLRLEWLFRICGEPRRLTPRYLFDALWLAKVSLYEWLKR